jgi:hypothetical protein
MLMLALPLVAPPPPPQVGPGYTSLQQPTNLPALAPLIGKQLPPEQLLLTLSFKGMHLLPEDRDAPVGGRSSGTCSWVLSDKLRLRVYFMTCSK